MSPNSDMHVGPHSLQVGPDGDVWITLATGNRLARFDPEEGGIHARGIARRVLSRTRSDSMTRGRIWYTIAASNHVGVYDPSSGRHEVVRVPARSFGEEIMLRLLPTFMWLGQYVDLSATAAAGEGASMPASLWHRYRTGWRHLVLAAERPPHWSHRSGNAGSPHDRYRVHRTPPHAFRLEGPAVDPRVFVQPGGSIRPGHGGVRDLRVAHRTARHRDALRAERRPQHR